MGLLTTLHRRLSRPSTPQKQQLSTSPPSTPPPLRRRIHRRRPSGVNPFSSSDLDGDSSPPFVRRKEHRRSASLSTPREISDSVVYAKACSAYLCGQALSVLSLRPSGSQEQHGETSSTREVFEHAKQNLVSAFELFERDQVQWAGYLMEGSRADRDDPQRARLFVQEGLEVMHAVDRARGEVDRVCGV